jgi:hypothetical protein
VSDFTHTREPKSKPELIGSFLPAVLRELAAEYEDHGAATRLRLLAAVFESSTEEEALAA